MIHQIENCQKCPLFLSNNEGDICNHTEGLKLTMLYEKFPKDTIHKDCPLKVVDLILTVRK